MDKETAEKASKLLKEKSELVSVQGTLVTKPEIAVGRWLSIGMFGFCQVYQPNQERFHAFVSGEVERRLAEVEEELASL